MFQCICVYLDFCVISMHSFSYCRMCIPKLWLPFIKLVFRSCFFLHVFVLLFEVEYIIRLSGDIYFTSFLLGWFYSIRCLPEIVYCLFYMSCPKGQTLIVMNGWWVITYAFVTEFDFLTTNHKSMSRKSIYIFSDGRNLPLHDSLSNPGAWLALHA